MIIQSFVFNPLRVSYFLTMKNTEEVWRATEGLGWLGSFFLVRHSFFCVVRSNYFSPQRTQIRDDGK